MAQICGYFDHDGTGNTQYSLFNSMIFDCRSVTDIPTAISVITDERIDVAQAIIDEIVPSVVSDERIKTSATTSERVKVAGSTDKRVKSSVTVDS